MESMSINNQIHSVCLFTFLQQNHGNFTLDFSEASSFISLNCNYRKLETLPEVPSAPVSME